MELSQVALQGFRGTGKQASIRRAEGGLLHLGSSWADRHQPSLETSCVLLLTVPSPTPHPTPTSTPISRPQSSSEAARDRKRLYQGSPAGPASELGVWSLNRRPFPTDSGPPAAGWGPASGGSSPRGRPHALVARVPNLPAVGPARAKSALAPSSRNRCRRQAIPPAPVTLG